MRIALLLTLTLATSSARADQCAWIAPDLAQAGAAAIIKGRSIVHYCAICKDKAPPSPPRNARSVAVRPVGRDGLREVAIDGKGVDLAYVYVKTGDGIYTNVAKLAGCPLATPVPEQLAI